MPLFFSTNELSEYADVVEGFHFTPFLGPLKTVDRMYIWPAVSKILYNDIKAKVASSTANAQELDVYALLREAEAKLAFWKWIPRGLVKISSAGIHIVTGPDTKAAFQWMTYDLARSWIEEGFSALEDALAYLHENLIEFPQYKDSPEYTENYSGFVNTASEMHAHFTLALPRVTFLQTASIRRRIEKEVIRPITGDTLADHVIYEIQQGSLSANNKAIIDFIRGAVVNLTISRAVVEMSVTIDDRGISLFRNKESDTTNVRIPAEDNRLQHLINSTAQTGNAYLAKLKNYLISNAADFSLFTAPAPTTSTYKNTENSAHFAAF
jgi:predicted DNA-binding protein